MSERESSDLDLFTGTDEKETDAVRGLLGRWNLRVTELNISDDGVPSLITPAGCYVGYEKIESFCRISQKVMSDLTRNDTWKLKP